ncbi:MAG TPA: YbaY family lipoprotein [Polyangiaceae bacterium]|nr:YbaY family lipoprotein [Polyangiaceae bacterium]
MVRSRLLLLLVFLGCARNPEAPGGGTVTGTVAHQGRLILPGDAVVEVQLVALSRKDSPGRIVAQTTFTPMGRLAPLPFELRYPPSVIEPTHSYAVRATIRSGGFLLYATDPHVPVLTRGNPSHVKLRLIPTRGAPK